MSIDKFMQDHAARTEEHACDIGPDAKCVGIGVGLYEDKSGNFLLVTNQAGGVHVKEDVAGRVTITPDVWGKAITQIRASNRQPEAITLIEHPHTRACAHVHLRAVVASVLAGSTARAGGSDQLISAFCPRTLEEFRPKAERAFGAANGKTHKPLYRGAGDEGLQYQFGTSWLTVGIWVGETRICLIIWLLMLRWHVFPMHLHYTGFSFGYDAELKRRGVLARAIVCAPARRIPCARCRARGRLIRAPRRSPPPTPARAAFLSVRRHGGARRGG